LPDAQVGHVPPPQSTSVSKPFFFVSVQLGAWHRPPVHTWLEQSVPAVHVAPVGQRWHVVVPPQSIALSPPFFTPSLQAGTWQIPPVHTPL
jgi:hypothetical protein